MHLSHQLEQIHFSCPYFDGILLAGNNIGLLYKTKIFHSNNFEIKNLDIGTDVMDGWIARGG